MRRRFIAMSAACGVALGLGACGGGDPESLTFDVAIEDRAIVGGQTEFEAKGGDSVTFNLTADEAAEFHVHGYDLRAESPAGGEATIAFTADATGSFPITVHLGEADAAAGEDAMGTHGHEETSRRRRAWALRSTSTRTACLASISRPCRRRSRSPRQGEHGPRAGEGHVHLYIDGVKLRRVYGEWATSMGCRRHARDSASR